MHTDEANQAVKLGQLLEQNYYRYDPQDHHGPTLYYFAKAVARFTGAETLAELSETNVRLTPAIFGIAALVLVWLITYPLGKFAALMASLFFALSPPAVYYSRYFIQESLLVTFTLFTWWSGAKWLRSGNWRWAVIAGCGVGLMLATKASAAAIIVISILSLTASGQGKRLLHLARDTRAVAASGFVALLVSGAFYSSFGQNWRGLADAITSFSSLGSRALAGTSGHEKSWWYYGSLFSFQRVGGYIWDQTSFMLLALAGAVVAWRRNSRLLRFISIYIAALALVISVTPYKTPWIAINLVPGLCMLGGSLLARWRWSIAAPAAAFAAVLLAFQTRQAVFSRPADPRNPYAYQHTVPDILKVRALAANAPEGAVKIISPEYWPLPWYLRSRPEVGYWHTPPEDCDGVLVFVSIDQADSVEHLLSGSYEQEIIGLRPGYTLVVFTKKNRPLR